VITHIEISGFKSLEKMSLNLGALNIFLATNASGKSNFFDALRVLQGIGYGLTIGEIFDGKPKSANSEVWDPIRGGSANAGFLRWKSGEAKPVRDAVRLKVTLTSSELDQPLTYALWVACRAGAVWSESLHSGDTRIFDTGPSTARSRKSPTIRVSYYDDRGRQLNERFEKSRPVLHQLLKFQQASEQHRGLIAACSRLLSNAQFLNPAPAVLQDYSAAPVVRRVGERGEGFAALVESIMSDRHTAAAYTSWLKQLTPAEVGEIVTLHGALQEPLFAIKRRGQAFPAPVLSDGTLRFAAITAAFFQPDMPDELMLEEIENGIHPTRLRLLIELLKSRTAGGRPQVMATTHSPLVLAWLSEEDYKTTFYCKKDEETGASTITPLADIPRFRELARKQPAADLFAEGWLETAL